MEKPQIDRSTIKKVASCVPYTAFESFCNAYSRATKILESFYGFSHKSLFKRVCFRGREAFERFKFISKSLKLWLWMITGPVNDQRWIVEQFIKAAAALWDKSGLRYCPSGYVIERDYLTKVKQSAPEHSKTAKSHSVDTI